jgi:hypothetical protein
MEILFVVIPFLAMVSGLLLYRHIGKREILRLDMVQFFYAFVLTPALFVWSKSFLYYVVVGELGVRLSRAEMFIIDTVFSTVFLYTFAFIVIHSVTKSFSLRTATDPLYNLFQHSEYFHLWLSHLVLIIGSIAFVSIASFINAWFPLLLELPQPVFYIVCALGVAAGTVAYIGVLLADPKQHQTNLVRLVKLGFGITFLAHIMVYFIAAPSFSLSYGLYWWTFFLFGTTVVATLFSNRSERARTRMERITSWFKHLHWDFRLQLWDSQKK